MALHETFPTLFRSSFIIKAVSSFSHNSLSPQVVFPVYPWCFRTWLIFRWQWLRYWDCRLRASSQLHTRAETDCHWCALDSNNLERLKTVLNPLSVDSSVNQARSLALSFFNRPLSSCFLPQSSLLGNHSHGNVHFPRGLETEGKVPRKWLISHFVLSRDRTTRTKWIERTWRSEASIYTHPNVFFFSFFVWVHFALWRKSVSMGIVKFWTGLIQGKPLSAYLLQ